MNSSRIHILHRRIFKRHVFVVLRDKKPGFSFFYEQSNSSLKQELRGQDGRDLGHSTGSPDGLFLYADLRDTRNFKSGQ
ncbi:hypothetical protein MKW98_017807 [Papaver atlanticum]|uniref:Uncharacterized protein n=1 Tax=Papaver atlanticum TaxID=357466 RepID=A0AAD4TBY0_9MAGN|nr:hypothetical protein MKW98_017807 [Papaver atlanticum]